MNRRTRSLTVSLSSSASFALAAATLIVSVAGCSRRDKAPAPVQSTAPSPAPASVPAASAAHASTVVLPIREGARALLNPIHADVEVGLGEDAATIAYTRTRGKAFGVAYMIEPKALTERDALLVAIKTQPALRPQLCLTDAAGNVWNAPAIVEDASGWMRFDLSRLQPDPFQNAGRTLPASADLAAMRMFTILDISGFMGGAEVQCRWTIERLELTARSNSNASEQNRGGGR